MCFIVALAFVLSTQTQKLNYFLGLFQFKMSCSTVFSVSHLIHRVIKAC
jgi:hypothetical protein